MPDQMSDSATRTKPSPKPRPVELDKKVDEKLDEKAAGGEPEISVGQAVRRLLRGFRPSFGLRTAGVVLLVVALAAAGAYFGWQDFQRKATADAQSAALSAGRVYAADLYTYDYRTLSTNFKKVSANSTGSFAKQYAKVGQSLTKLLQQYRGTSKGKIVQAGLAQGNRERAVVILFVDQTITNTNSPQPRVDRNRLQMVLLYSGGRWLVDNVTLL